MFLHLSDGPALVLVSGTDSICYGRDENGTVCRTSGWNHIVSDEGSGFYLGLQFLRAAANDLDGREAAPVFTSMMTAESGLDTLEKINDFINESLFEKARIARLAKTGYEAARAGDVQAVRIQEQCSFTDEKRLSSGENLVSQTLHRSCPLEPLFLYRKGFGVLQRGQVHVSGMSHSERRLTGRIFLP